jgi:hypothetical protein
MKWLHSLKGKKVYSDLAVDDMMPGLHETVLENILWRSGRYVLKKFRKISI